MRDRLGDLGQGGGGGNQPPAPPPMEEKKRVAEKKVNKKDKDLEKGAQEGESEAMKGFFDEIAYIRDSIGVIKQSIDQIDAMHQQALNVISEDESKEKAEELERLMERTNKQSGDIRNKLKNMDTVNKTLAKDPKNANDVRIRASQHGTLAKRFLDVMMEYKEIQKKYQEKYKQRVQRQFLIVKPTATTEEIQNMINSDSGPIFAQQVSGGQRAEARRALQDIQDRHQDIVRIERSIIELQQLFIDMSVLVAAQGELLNQIETHVANAVDTTEAGVEALKGAVKLQKKTRKKMMIIIFCLCLLGGAIAAAVSLSTKK